MKSIVSYGGESILVAHRGASTLSPENTLQAGRAAAWLGAKAWEFDIDLTRDGEIVLMHDETPARTTNANTLFPERAGQPLATWTCGELQRLDATARFIRPVLADLLHLPPLCPEPVPTLDEALAVAKEEGLMLFPEMKGRDPLRLADAFAAKIASSGMVDQMIVISFDLGGLLRLKQQIPSVRIMPLFGLGSLPDDPVKLIRDTRSCGLDVQEAAVTEALARELRKAGYLLNVWTVNKTASLARLAQWRADYLTTDTLFLAPSPNPLPERPEEFEALRDRRSIPLSGIKWRYAEAGN